MPGCSFQGTYVRVCVRAYVRVYVHVCTEATSDVFLYCLPPYFLIFNFTLYA